MKLTIIDIAHHRNGICGAPFAAVLFEDTGPEGSRKIGILFDEPYHCAVLDVAKLAAGDIAFRSNILEGRSLRAPPAESRRSHRRPAEAAWILTSTSYSPNARQIAHIWSIEDVQSIRPDLSEEQAWEVLQDVKIVIKDAELGINWLTLEMARRGSLRRRPRNQRSEEA